VKSIISLATLGYFLADFQLARWPNMAVVDIWRGGLLDITRHVAVNAFSAENSLPKTVVNSDSVTVFKSSFKKFLFSPGLSLFPSLSSTLPGPSASEVTTLWRYTNRPTFIITIVI